MRDFERGQTIMASKFTKFLTFTAIIGAATAAGVALYKKHNNKAFIEDDFDDFDDFDDDDFDDLEEDRGYTSIIPDEDKEDDDMEDELTSSLTDEEKDALLSSESAENLDDTDADSDESDPVSQF